ncbi:hypothetical protein [Paenibacillus lautus]|uniref:hypothetical protein n=1 Tax=Paenibacillus TaxID=44249 RepID=UPI002FBD368D
MNIRADRTNQCSSLQPEVDLQPRDPGYDNLKQSIQNFGYGEPIVWNERTGNMVGGHQRFKIMVHEQGHTELAVSVVDLDDQQERLLNGRIVLRRIAIRGSARSSKAGEGKRVSSAYGRTVF